MKHRWIDTEYARRLNRLIECVDEAVEYERKHGEPGKMYEGEWEITLHVSPTDEDWMNCTIKLHCYLIGPSRHYEWKGASIEEALNKCEKDVLAWCKEVYDDGDEE